MRIAASVGAEIVSVDSMQVYRGMDIGTAKPTAAERDRVPHHLVDIVEPEERFTVAEFQEAGRAALADLSDRRVPAMIVGGSGLHFRSLVDPMHFPGHDDSVRETIEAMDADEARDRLVAADPEAGDVVDLANPRRVARALEILEVSGETPSQRAAGPEARALRAYEPEIPFAAVGVDPGDALVERVEARLDRMLAAGWVAEVVRLRERLGPTALQAVGYRELVHVADGEWTLGQARDRILGATTALARRQRTFHRRDPRIRWIEWDDDPDVLAARATAALEEAGWTS
jgi:tRNA dimethylallyltransferase